MAIINAANLRHYLDLKYNVLFRGQHGVGKTAIISQIFDAKYGEGNWRYFSASTLDPWVDFVGIPKVVEVPEAEGSIHTRSVLKMIRPDFIENDSVKAIFFDEYNRAPDKVLNATMELIQFKSINGHKLRNLDVIWASINPDDDEDTYTVNHIDPAQLDRFQIHIDVPYTVDKDYFLKKYPTVGQIFLDWWDGLTDDTKFLVSPRRLDYAADAYLNDCRIEDVLPKISLPKKLRDMLKALPFTAQIRDINSLDDASKFLADHNNATRMLDMVKSGEKSAIDLLKKYGKVLPGELIAPYLEWLQAKINGGIKPVTSIEAFINGLPDHADAGTGTMINNTDFDVLYKNGGSLEKDILALATPDKINLVKKLANRICDVLFKCKNTTIDRLMWGIGGRIANTPTNFQKLLKIVGSIEQAYTKTQRTTINNKLYSATIVEVPNFI